MARGLHAADGGRGLAFTPRVELSNFFASLKPVVAHHHHAVRQVILGAVPAIAIDLVPISRLEAVKRVPKIEAVVSVHVAPRVIAEAVAVGPAARERGFSQSPVIPPAARADR